MTTAGTDVVVDSHVHLLPDRLAAKIRSFFEPIAASIVYPIDREVIRQRLAEAGIDEVWTLPYAHKPGMAAWLNAEIAQIAAESGPLTVVNGATVHPGDDDPAEIVRRAVGDLGARVLKLHCSVGDYEASDPRLDPVWSYVSTSRLPVVVHVGHATDGTTAHRELAPIDDVARRFPSATIVIAHCAHPADEPALDLVERHEQVYADLTPVMTEVPRVPVERMAAIGHKLLFGSDAPNTGIDAGDHLAAVRALSLDTDQRASITGGLARRLTDSVS